MAPDLKVSATFEVRFLSARPTLIGLPSRVTLPDVGTWTASNPDGHFRFDRLPPGRHRLLARTADGREADGHIEVPGAGLDLVIDGKG